jgi:hypothetical protein
MDTIQYVTPDFTITVTPKKVTAQLADDILPAEGAHVDITNTPLGKLLLFTSAHHFANAVHPYTEEAR